MKCIKKGDNRIIRVSDKRAEHLVYKQGYEYCPKRLFKKQERSNNEETL